MITELIFYKYFKNLDKALQEAGNIEFWWREDDLYAIEYPSCKKFVKYYKNILIANIINKLYSKFNIPAVFAVIPKNYDLYGEPLTKLFNNKNFKFILHGIEHKSRSKNDKNEFPDESKCDEDYKLITEKYNMLKNVLGDNFVKSFCPPYNVMNEKLENQLTANGFIVSKANWTKDKKPYNIDYDFCDWNKCKLKPYKQILKELTKLIKSGRKTIGFNDHYQRLRPFDYFFFNALFKIIRKNKNIKWINPLL